MHKEKAIKKIRYVITTLVVFMAAIMGKSYFSVVEANAEETEHSAVYVESKGEDSISAVQVTSDNVAASEDKSSNVKTGWKKIDDKWYYYDSNSVLQKSKWINTNSKWYYVGKTGEMMAKKPEKVVELAVKGMLPKGPLGRSMITKLHVYAGPEHEQAAQKPEVLEIKF